MLSRQRLELIMSRLRENQFVKVEELAGRFGVTPITIRRDLEKLEEAGLVVRLYGGARLKCSTDGEQPYAVKALSDLPVKQAIAREAVKLIKNDMNIILDSGTTTMEIAKLLVELDPALTVVTNDLHIAACLLKSSSIEVLMLGGKILSD